MTWFTRKKPSVEAGGEAERHIRTEGLWQKCVHCSQIVWRKALEDNQEVCPKCDHHFRIDAHTRLKLLFDDGHFEAHESGMSSTDPLQFVDAKPYHRAARRHAGRRVARRRDLGQREAGRTARQHLRVGMKFIGGSMGSVVGEKITRAIERSIDGEAAADHRLRLRRRAHAGRRRQPDADGEDLRAR